MERSAPPEGEERGWRWNPITNGQCFNGSCLPIGPSIKVSKQLGSAAFGLVRHGGAGRVMLLEGALPPFLALCLSSVLLFCCILYNKLVNVNRVFFGVLWATVVITKADEGAKGSPGVQQQVQKYQRQPLTHGVYTNSLREVVSELNGIWETGESLGVGSRLSQIPVRRWNSARASSLGGLCDTPCEAENTGTAFSSVSLPCCSRKDWRQHLSLFFAWFIPPAAGLSV